MHATDSSVYCLLVTHCYIDSSTLARGHPNATRHSLTTTSACGVGSPTSPGHAAESRMALQIFPDCGFRQGIEAQSVALAIEPYRREFLFAKHGDDPMQRNTARAPDKFGVHEFTWHNLCRQYGLLGNSANWT